MGILKRNDSYITYTLDKGFGRNLAISIQNGQVAVTAPWYVSKRKIDQVISNKKAWIIQKLKEYEEINNYKKNNSEIRTIKVFGENYDLKISYKFIKSPELYLEDKTIKIELPSKYKNSDNAKILDLIIEKFYLKLAEKEIEQIMEKTRLMLKLAPDDYKIQKIGKALGKYEEENRTIIINPDIVKYDKEIVEYVILHEFCHLIYKTHCKSFYQIIKKYSKNYLSIEQKIKGMF